MCGQQGLSRLVSAMCFKAAGLGAILGGSTIGMAQQPPRVVQPPRQATPTANPAAAPQSAPTAPVSAAPPSTPSSALGPSSTTPPADAIAAAQTPKATAAQRPEQVRPEQALSERDKSEL